MISFVTNAKLAKWDGPQMGPSRSIRLAAAQVEVSEEAPTASVLAASGARIRAQMVRASEAGVRVVHFPEGTLTYPSKLLIGERRPEIGEADWTMADWRALRAELRAVADCSRELGIWTVIGAPHQLSDGRRPHNSLHIFSDKGELITRYDKRRLATPEITDMYTPETDAIVFEVDGFRWHGPLPGSRVS